MHDRLIDRERLGAQVEQLQRITRSGEIDVELAMRERRSLADRVENRRTLYLSWMRKKGWPQLIIEDELVELDRLLVELRTEPFSRQGLQMPDLGF